LSKLIHDISANMPPRAKRLHDLLTDPILSMTDLELDDYLEANLRSAVDTREFLKKLTKIVAAAAKK
jgi:hypothetical protein